MSKYKWKTLSHQGLVFPKPYQPHNIAIKVLDTKVEMTPIQEEYATYFAKLHPKYRDNKILCKNFWKEYKNLFDKNSLVRRSKLSDVDFTEIQKYLETKTPLSKQEKEAILEKEEKYRFCYVDGKKEKIDNYRIEPPGIFIGRGCHPMMGRLKQRIQPVQVTINIGRGENIPSTPLGPYGNIIHNRSVAWIASWNDPISGTKYVYPSMESELRKQNDIAKFELARKLKKRIGRIRRTNNKNLESNNERLQQLAVCFYLIDNYALRAGNEKSDNESDTVGVCSLRIEHITLETEKIIILNFLGKDSIRYYNRITVPKEVYNALKKIIGTRAKTEPLFDKVSTRDLNQYLQIFMKCLTAKVFRTYNASNVMEQELKKLEPQYYKIQDGESEKLRIEEVMLHYNKANAKVAIMCNHQKAVPENHGKMLKKLNEMIRKLEEKKKTSKNSKNKKKLKEKIQKYKLKKKSKKELSNVSLGTSKMNYIDPRIIVSYFKKTNLPITKVFTEKLQNKFNWALNIDKDFEF